MRGLRPGNAAVIPSLEGFVPFLYLKLPAAHILREEPYRPEDEKGVCLHAGRETIA